MTPDEVRQPPRRRLRPWMIALAALLLLVLTVLFAICYFSTRNLPVVNVDAFAGVRMCCNSEAIVKLWPAGLS